MVSNFGLFILGMLFGLTVVTLGFLVSVARSPYHPSNQERDHDDHGRRN
jgi:hypothetical protein